MRPTLLALTALLAAAWMGSALADPPAHAPAHGWRKQHDPYYVGYTGTKWERDYDVLSGRCDREAVGAVLGGVVGGVIGSRVGDREHRTVATILGAAVGALIGAKIGRELDAGDRACVGHALEIGKAGRRVMWENAASGIRYELTPGAGRKSGAATCRDFTLVAVAGAEKSSRRGTACQSEPGVWRIATR